MCQVLREQQEQSSHILVLNKTTPTTHPLQTANFHLARHHSLQVFIVCFKIIDRLLTVNHPW